MGSRKYHSVILTVCISMVVLCGVDVFARVIRVPSEYDTIQSAVDNSIEGDEILISPGTYVENIVFKTNRHITIRGEGGRDKTIIDGNGGTAISFSDLDSGDTSLSIESVSIVNSDIAVLTFGNYYKPRLRIDDCRLHRNGIAIDGHFHVEVVILNSLVTQNDTGYRQTYYGEDSLILNSTFADNTVDIDFTPAYDERNELTITNSILRGEIRGHHDNDPVYLNYCNYDPSKIGTNVVLQQGNHTGDPVFVDIVNGDYTLGTESPCIDGGDPNGFYNDLDGTRNDIGYTGGNTGLSVSVGRLDFGYVSVGSAKELVLTVHNSTETEIILTSLSIYDSELTTESRFPLTVSTDSDLTMSFNFNPSVKGEFES